MVSVFKKFRAIVDCAQRTHHAVPPKRKFKIFMESALTALNQAFPGPEIRGTIDLFNISIHQLVEMRTISCPLYASLADLYRGSEGC